MKLNICHKKKYKPVDRKIKFFKSTIQQIEILDKTKRTTKKIKNIYRYSLDVLYKDKFKNT